MNFIYFHKIHIYNHIHINAIKYIFVEIQSVENMNKLNFGMKEEKTEFRAIKNI